MNKYFIVPYVFTTSEILLQKLIQCIYTSLDNVQTLTYHICTFS